MPIIYHSTIIDKKDGASSGASRNAALAMLLIVSLRVDCRLRIRAVSCWLLWARSPDVQRFHLPSPPPPRRRRAQVFFDIAIAGKPAGKIVFELYSDVVPKTVCNGAQAKLCAAGVPALHPPPRRACALRFPPGRELPRAVHGREGHGQVGQAAVVQGLHLPPCVARRAPLARRSVADARPATARSAAASPPRAGVIPQFMLQGGDFTNFNGAI